MRKPMIVAIALTLMSMALNLVPAHASPGQHGCVATVGTSCTFLGLWDSTAPTGVISATDAAWTITYVSAGTTYTKASGAGPGVTQLVFFSGVTYTLTVGDAPITITTLTVDAGAGAVAAGTPE